MSLYASLGPSRVVSARLTIDGWGAPVGDVLLADDSELPSGRIPFVLGNLALVVTPLPGRNGTFAGSRSVRFVGGAGGWRTRAPREMYAKPQGVKLATVLRDVAIKVGETVALSTAFATRVLGVFWARAEGTASNTLALTVGKAWWVDLVGVTQIGERPATVIASEFTPTDYKPHLGLVTIATEDPLSWQPGATFAHPLLPVGLAVGSVSLALEPKGKLRLEVMTA